MNMETMTVFLFMCFCICLPVTTTAFNLLTFDVDGTLVRGLSNSESAHNRAFSMAVGQVLGDGTPVPPLNEALKKHENHGSTDGLILLRLARATLQIEPVTSAPKLPEMMQAMYDYISTLSDEEVGRNITPLPGVLSNMNQLSTMKDRVSCGLVTGNVEGIARRKMHAVGIYESGALTPPGADQLDRTWEGAEDIGFLGGFGSDYCSGDIDRVERNYLDRAEQIAIATTRCQGGLLLQRKTLRRVVHIGDAPSDVLAAKAFSESEQADIENVCVGMVAVATGSFSADELQELVGETKPGRWEPVVLEDGMGDPNFLEACGLC